MKTRIVFAVLFALGCAWGARAEEKTATETPVVRDTIYKNSTQYALDSLKYASQIELEKVKNDRYTDSVVYAQMSSEQLYTLQMKKNDRYWRSDFENFMYHGPLVTLMVGLCIMLLFWMVLKARDKGKQRSHELKMAQFEAMQKARIIYREQEARRPGGERKDEEDVYEMPDYVSRDYSRDFENAVGSVKSYLSSPRKYRKTGVVMILIALGTMFFFASISNNGPWQLGLIPLFIGFAYLYLDYSAQKSDRNRREMEEFLRYKAQKQQQEDAQKRGAENAGEENPAEKTEDAANGGNGL